MDNRIELVLCKHPNDSGLYLFEAPAFASMSDGDTVVVNTRRGETMAVVVGHASDYVGGEYYKMLVAATGAREPLMRVKARVDFYTYKYPEATDE